MFVLPDIENVPIGSKIKFKVNKEALKHKPLQLGIAHWLRVSPSEIKNYKVYDTNPEEFKLVKGPLLPLEKRNDTLFFKSNSTVNFKIAEGSTWKSKNGRKITIEKIEIKKFYSDSEVKLKFGKSMKMKHLICNYYPIDPNSITHQ
jgi:hypothetical protein